MSRGTRARGGRVLRRGRLQRQQKGSEDGEDREGTYEVEAIIADALVGGVQFYELKWKGFSDEHNRWVLAGDLNCLELLEEYRQRRPRDTADVGPFYDILKDAKEETITVVNAVDDVGFPENFKYVNESTYSDDVPRPCTPMFPCQCVDNCVGECPCAPQQYYDDEGRVRIESDTALMECGPRCRCSSACRTRVVQRGSDVRFEIRRFAVKGWGVVTRTAVACGTFVAEYVGEILSYDETEARGKADTERGLTYMFDLDNAYDGETDFSIDAKTQGNVSHFFNHSCAPNMKIRAVYIEHRDPRLHRLAFFAVRDIGAGEELTFDYNPGGTTNNLIACACGAADCRKFIL
ncbi:hypothetical protein GGF46_002146 [Coemansia sp. RSA 552]|nr:hypothetical protein GGF46_002146 [Coemansia sp. RSA 552]